MISCLHILTISHTYPRLLNIGWFVRFFGDGAAEIGQSSGLITKSEGNLAQNVEDLRVHGVEFVGILGDLQTALVLAQ